MKKKIGVWIFLLCVVAGSFGTACNKKENTEQEVSTVLKDVAETEKTDTQERIEEQMVFGGETSSEREGKKAVTNSEAEEVQAVSCSVLNGNQEKQKKNITGNTAQQDSTVNLQADGEEIKTTKKNDGTKVTTGNTKNADCSEKSTKIQNTEKEAVDNGASVASVPTKEIVHEHTWEPVQTLVHYEAVTEEVWVEDAAAWTEEIPVFEVREQPVCVTCGIDIEGNPNAHLNAVCRQWRNEPRNVQVGTKTITHEAQGHYETKTIKEAYDEWVTTGSRCTGCGAVQ